MKAYVITEVDVGDLTEEEINAGQHSLFNRIVWAMADASMAIARAGGGWKIRQVVFSAEPAKKFSESFELMWVSDDADCSSNSV
jgi:hypothetical protein